MSEYFVITNASSTNLSHAELSEMQKAGKVKAYGPYSAEAILKYFADGKIKGNTVVYEKGAPFTQAFSDIYPALRSGDVDFGTPVHISNDNFQFEIEQNTSSVPQKNRPVQHRTGSSNYITSSWRGEKSLAVSYWVNGFIITFLLQLAIGIYSSASVLFPYVARSNVKLYNAIALLFEVFAIALAVWQTVGIWRSADNHKKLTGKKFYAVLAQIVMVITAIGLFVKIGTLGSYYNDVFWNALGKDPLGGYDLQVSNDGSKLNVSGVISFGLASDVDKVLASNPGIKTVVLNSEGGRIWEGENLYDVLKSRNIHETRTETGCSSACTIPFMAGEVRTIKDDKPLLGFHSSSSPYYTDVSDNADNRRWQTFLISKGVSIDFTRQALGTPPDDMWFPDYRLLTKEKIVMRNYGSHIDTYNKLEMDGLGYVYDILYSKWRAEKYEYVAHEYSSSIQRGVVTFVEPDSLNGQGFMDNQYGIMGYLGLTYHINGNDDDYIETTNGGTFCDRIEIFEVKRCRYTLDGEPIYDSSGTNCTMTTPNIMLTREQYKIREYICNQQPLYKN